MLNDDLVEMFYEREESRSFDSLIQIACDTGKATYRRAAALLRIEKLLRYDSRFQVDLETTIYLLREIATVPSLKPFTLYLLDWAKDALSDSRYIAKYGINAFYGVKRDD